MILSLNGVKPVIGVRPTGSQVLVEMLTEQELHNTKLTLVGGKQKSDRQQAFQGFVLAVGPSVKLEDWGFNVGDRVLISGQAVPCPNWDSSGRDRVLLEPMAIRGIVEQG